MKVGDIVQLKSGGPMMTVSSEMEDDQWLCMWFNASLCLEESELPIECLKKWDYSTFLSGSAKIP